MRKTRPRKRPLSYLVFFLYIFTFLALCCVHVSFLRNQHALQEFDARGVEGKVDHASVGTPRTYQDPAQRKLEDYPPTETNRQHRVPMEPRDFMEYTVRLNSWKRPEQLFFAIEHYKTCPGVASIQVVWCTTQGDPPEWLLQALTTSRVVLERHDVNSLNERFNVLIEPPTRGILTVDDDVLRPCLALDAGFYKWTLHPDRMVGYDARTIAVDEESDQWKYGYLSTTKSTNQYHLTLTRFAFIHVDYLKEYMNEMPQSIRDKVHEHLNCEDIAMSLWVSSQTNAQVPLLADCWAMKTLVKLHSNGAISAMGGHKRVRDKCVDEFATILGLKGKLQPALWVHSEDPFFQCGIDVGNERLETAVSSVPRLQQLQQLVVKWRKLGHKVASQQTKQLVAEMIGPALKAGLVQGTEPWKQRFEKADT